MRSLEGRETKVNGPTQTGCWPKSLPSFLIWAGDCTMPARPARIEVSGANGWVSCSVSVVGFTTLIESIADSESARDERGSLILRSRVVLTAAASNAVPSLKVAWARSLIV